MSNVISFFVGFLSFPVLFFLFVFFVRDDSSNR